MKLMRTHHLLRVTALFLIVLLLLAAAGCGNSPSAGSPSLPQTEEPVAEPTEGQPTPSDAQDAGPSSADQALFAELVEANSAASIFERHTSSQVDGVAYYEDGQEANTFTFRVAEGEYTEHDDTGYALMITDGLFLYVLPSEEDPDAEPDLVEVLFDTEEGYLDELAAAFSTSTLNIEAEEVLTAALEQDGQVYMTTELADGDWIRNRLETEAQNWQSDSPYPYVYADGMAFVYLYTFDAETKDLLQIASTLREADGTEHSFAVNTFTYDQEFDVMESPFARYYEIPDYTALTLVLAPGTAEERERMYALPHGVYWVLVVDGEEYLGDVYTDADCTQVYQTAEDGKKPEELTLYVPLQG